MASPQLENGYTRIANELLDALALLKLAGQEWQIVLAIIRKTYGYGKKEDCISYNQLSKITSIPRTRVIGRVKRLVSKRILGSLKTETRRPLTFWINKDFSQWIVPSPQTETRLASPQKETFASPRSETHKRKKEIKEYIYITPSLGEFQNVKLTEQELTKLNESYGEEEIQKRIESLSEYMASKGKRYSSHYATILSWLRRDGYGNKKDGPRYRNDFLDPLLEEIERNGGPKS